MHLPLYEPCTTGVMVVSVVVEPMERGSALSHQSFWLRCELLATPNTISLPLIVTTMCLDHAPLKVRRLRMHYRCIAESFLKVRIGV